MTVPLRPRFAWLELDASSPRFLRRPAEGPPPTPPSPERWVALVDELADAGVTSVQVHGARPLGHPAFEAVLARALSRGLAVEVDLGDSWPLPDAAALDRFAAAGVGLVVPLHSHLAPVHDGIAGRSGAWAATLELLQAVGTRGIGLRVTALRGSANADHAPQVEALVRALGGLGPVRFDGMRGTGFGVPGWDPTAAATACVLVDDSGFAHEHPMDEGPTPATCWSGRVAVTADGALHPCPLARGIDLGRVADGPVMDQLTRHGAQALWDLSTDAVPPCSGCDRKGTCYDCRALALAATGELLAKRPNCDYQPPSERLRRTPPERLQWAPHLAQARLEDEVLVLDVVQRTLHRMNDSAAWLLEVLGRGHTRAEALAALRADLPPEDAETVDPADLEQLATLFHAQGLLLEPRVRPRSTPAPRVSGGGVPAVSEVPVRCVVQVAGVRVALEASDEAWRLLADWVMPLTPPPQGLTARSRLTVWSRGPAQRRVHHVLLDGHPLGRSDAAGLTWLVADALGKVVIEAPGAVAFHAAALSGRAGVALLPGASGMGKSTFTLHAVAAGLGYLTDELAAVEPHGQLVRAFARPVGVTPEGVSLVPEGLRGGLLEAAYPGAKRWLVLPPAAPAPLVAVVIPDRHRPAGLEPLRPGDAAEVLVSQAFGLGSQVEPRAFLARLVALAQRLPVYRLGTADLPEAAACLSRLLEGPLAPAG